MSKTIVVGDVHGCSDELGRLLDKVHFGPGDALYLLGDLLSRGPDPKGVLAVIRQTEARAVRGNHDDTLVRWRTRERAAKHPRHPLLFWRRGAELPPAVALGKGQRKLVKQLDEADFDFLEKLPLWLDLPRHDVRLVHAGVIPGLPMEAQPERALLSMRYLGPSGEPIEKDGTVLWGARYVGPPHVVFGHNAAAEPQLHPWATGIDTSAVYGGTLTALVLADGEHVPPVAERSRVLFSVPARARYYEP
jgi:hypothetical protein